MAARRPRILLYSPVPPPTGGIATWARAVLDSFLADRYALHLIDTSPPMQSGAESRSRLRWNRVLPGFRILAGLLWQSIRRRPQVVHINSSYHWAFVRDGLALWIARLLGIRTVLHLRGGDFPEFVESKRPLARRAIEATLRRADRILVLTEATRTFLATVVEPGSLRKLPNFVDVQPFGALPDRSRREGPVEILFVGWILEAKGIGELLEAAECVPEARFTIVGPADPAFLRRIEPAVRALAERVRLLAPRPREQLLSLYREADLFVLPTWREGFPNVVLEAMAAGLPVVATPVGAIPDAIRNDSEGLLVEPRNPRELARALTALVRDPERRRAMGARARTRVEAEFSLPVVLEQLCEVYDSLSRSEPDRR